MSLTVALNKALHTWRHGAVVMVEYITTHPICIRDVSAVRHDLSVTLTERPSGLRLRRSNIYDHKLRPL